MPIKTVASPPPDDWDGLTPDECMAQSEARRLSIATGRVGGMRRRPRPVCDFCGKPLVGGRMCHDCGIDYREETDFQGDD